VLHGAERESRQHPEDWYRWWFEFKTLNAFTLRNRQNSFLVPLQFVEKCLSILAPSGSFQLDSRPTPFPISLTATFSAKLRRVCSEHPFFSKSPLLVAKKTKPAFPKNRAMRTFPSWFYSLICFPVDYDVLFTRWPWIIWHPPIIGTDCPCNSGSQKDMNQPLIKNFFLTNVGCHATL